ncbi:MAG: ABC transporter substrate-binding protein [Pseudomonadota bacterium]
MYINRPDIYRRAACIVLAAAAYAVPVFSQAQAPKVELVTLAELSGPGANSGTHFKAGVEMAVKEINAAGGILGRQISVKTLDTQSNPSVAKALATKAVDDEAFAIMGPIFSGSVLVSMEVAKQGEVPNFVGGEATDITLRQNPYVFRTSFSQARSMPKVARYVADTARGKPVAIVYVNNDFGKGGRDAVNREFKALGTPVAAEVSTDQGQVDFSSVVLQVKRSNAELLFAYLTVEESARLLRELRKQGWDKPILGETTIMQQSVITLAGEAANGARGHVGLTIDAPNPLVKAFADRFERDYKFKSSHEGIKGYTGVYILKAVTERVGKFDRKAVAAAMKNLKLSAKDHPGILLDVSYDDKGDIDRESYIVEVKNGVQAVIATLPALGR